MVDLPRVTYTELKSGEKGVSIGEERLFLNIKYSHSKWHFKLVDLTGGWHPRTAWVKLKDPRELQTSRKAKILRDILRTECGAEWEQNLEEVISVVQDKEESWFPKEEAKKLLRGGGSEKSSQQDRLILLCLSQKPELFHDQHHTPYVRIKQKGVNVTLPVRSRSFKAWLANLLWQSEQKAPGTEALYCAINVLEAMALFDGKEYTLHNRVAPAEDGFWIDLADDGWRAIKVATDGWHIVKDPPILFRRYSHQQALVEPKAGGDPWRLLEFININDEDEDTRLLLLCTSISYLIPMIPHVILVLYGIQGSGKTCLFKLLRRLIDPSAVEVLTLARDERERVQQLDHHWIAFFDNVTRLPTWMSDTLCRAATGGGFTKRELYTDDSDVNYNFKRCVGLNGINIAAQRGDLLDRSLLVGLQDIPKNRRRTEESLLAEFDNCRSEILGGFLDALVKAIRVYPSVNPEELFRMADFTRWGCAIAIALGCKEEDFLKAYATKVKAQIEEAAHASPVAAVLMDYMKPRQQWEGTPSQLYTVLIDHAKELGVSRNQKAWPKAPNHLVRQLNELGPSLRSLGWEVTTGIKRRRFRIILINTVPIVPTVQTEIAVDDKDSKDGILTSSSQLVDSYFLTCFLCRQPIHTETEAYTYQEGKPCHVKCLRLHNTKCIKCPNCGAENPESATFCHTANGDYQTATGDSNG